MSGIKRNLIAEKEAVSPVIGVILMVATTVVLAAVLYLWLSGFVIGGYTPIISLGYGIADSSKTNMTWSVISASRADIKWSDVSGTVFRNGTPVSSDMYFEIEGVEYIPGSAELETKYIKSTHRVRVELSAPAASGDKIDLILAYKPTGNLLASGYVSIT